MNLGTSVRNLESGLASRQLLPTLVFMAILMASNSERVAAVTLAGRAWTATEYFRVPGHTRTLPDIIRMGPAGAPYAYASLVGGVGADACRIEWADSAWTMRWKLGRDTNYLRPMPGSGRLGFVWNEPIEFFIPNVGYRHYVFVTEDLGGSAIVDTVSHMWSGHFSYGGAMSARRRWVAFGDNFESHMKLYYSDTVGVWRSIAVPGDGSAGIGMHVIDDTTALLAWGEGHSPVGIRWGVVRGSAFVEGERPQLSAGLTGVPQWLPHPGGGWWLAWVTKQNDIGMALLQGDTWVLRENVTANYQPPGTHYTDGSVDLLDVGRDRPMVGWSASRGGSYEQVYCLSIPTESGFGVGEPVGTPVDAFLPRYTVDGNGDTWVVWYTDLVQGMYFRHTYPRATTNTPTVSGASTNRTIRWTLSEPAPESWWSVLRAVSGGPFEVIGRAQAGEGTQMEFADASSTGRSFRYRVRRDCVDKRYEWLSPIRHWIEQKPRIQVLSANALVKVDQIEFAVADAAPGPIEVRLYDVQGRVVWKMRHESAEDTITMRFRDASGPIPSGLYFAIIQDSREQVSEPFKVAILR